MFLKMSTLEAHMRNMFATAKSETKQIYADLHTAIQNMEDRAEDKGSLLDLFKSHGGTTADARALLASMEAEDAKVAEGAALEPRVETPAVEAPKAEDVAPEGTEAPKDDAPSA